MRQTFWVAVLCLAGCDAGTDPGGDHFGPAPTVKMAPPNDGAFHPFKEWNVDSADEKAVKADAAAEVSEKKQAD